MGKERWWEIRDSGLCSIRDENSCSSGCRMVARGSSYHSSIFGFLKREGEEEGWVLGCSLILWLLAAGGGQCMFSGGVLRVCCLHRG
jgi:hypothetical protein